MGKALTGELSCPLTCLVDTSCAALHSFVFPRHGLCTDFSHLNFIIIPLSVKNKVQYATLSFLKLYATSKQRDTES